MMIGARALFHVQCNLCVAALMLIMIFIAAAWSLIPVR
jgi:hypothetical protein